VRTLVQHRQLVSFFNDLKVTDREPVIPAAQYFGTKGFFHDYNAALHEPINAAMKKVWRDGFDELQSGDLDPRDLAARVANAAADTDSPPTGQSRGEEILKMWKLLSAKSKPSE
jgi:hypothetical protein